MPPIDLHPQFNSSFSSGGKIPTATKNVTMVKNFPSLVEELANKLASSYPIPLHEMDTIARYHNRKVGLNQCCSAVVKKISAPIETIWGLVRRFDQPQIYKHFIRNCHVIKGDGIHVGCLREVQVVSGLPAASSTERLEVLDEDRHAIGFCIVGGDHRLKNYCSVTTLHPVAGGGGGEEETVVVESYVVDVPEGNTKQETCMFVDTIVRCNLHSLSRVVERMVLSSL